jgi:hypothetical protein
MLWLFALALSLVQSPLAPADVRRPQGEVESGGKGPIHGISARGSAPVFVETSEVWDTAARFVGRAGGVVVGIEPDAFTLRLERDESRDAPTALRFEFLGARRGVEVSGELPREARFSFFKGNDPERWVRGARSFDAVRAHGVYPGIDLYYRSNGAVLEYDLVLAPGADLSRVDVLVEGAEGLAIDAEGALVVKTSSGPLVKPRPRTFQPLADGATREVRCDYVLKGEQRFGFVAEDADGELSLVVDPELHWSTYIGSGWGMQTGDRVYAIATGPGGDVFVAGEVEGALFPVTGGAVDLGHPQGGDTFVARFRAEDGALLYACVLGSTQGFHWQDRPRAIVVDGEGRATVAGRTNGDDFPTTAGAYQSSTHGFAEAYVFRLAADGTDLVWSTLLGGTANDRAETLALAPSGAVVVGGVTSSADFPVTPGTWVDAIPVPGSSASFITRIDPTGRSIEWSTFVSMHPGGHGEVKRLVLGADEQVIVATQGGNAPISPGAWAPGGIGVGVLKLSADATELLWYSRFGKPPANTGSIVEVNDLAIDAFGNPVVVGWTSSLTFDTTPGAYQTTPPSSSFHSHGFVARLHLSGSHAIYSTYLSPSRVEAVDVDASGLVTVTWAGASFPATPGSYQPVYGGGSGDFFVCRLSPAGDKLLYSTFIGGPGTDWPLAVAIDATRRATVGGYSNGGYPTTPNAPFPSYIGGQTDAVITSLDLVLAGLELFGSSVPACLGPLHLNATEMPRTGAAGFAFFASGAPPHAFGALLVGQPAPGPFGAGGLLVVPTLAHISVQADEHGWIETPYSLAPFAPGATFAAQYAFRNPSKCTGPRPWSTTNALRVTVQP